MKILLVQLPVPNNLESNLPLAAGYLTATAQAAGLTDQAKITLLDRHTTDLAGDAALQQAILDHDPDLLGFSLYTWNVNRSLDLAAQVKASRPGLRVLVGGPEVAPDNPTVVAHPAPDFAVFGEGELTFVDLLRSLLAGQPAGDTIPGLGWRDSVGRWHWTQPRSRLLHLDAIPSPYLTGLLDAHTTDFFLLETSRWCPFGCTFCYYGKEKPAAGAYPQFSPERIRAELTWAREHGLTQIHLVDATFNLLPNFAAISQAIAKINADSRFALYAELRAEYLDADQVALLAAAGFRTVEVGLQSATPAALRAVRRPTHLEKFQRGVRLLRDQGIEVFLDLILGLPEETPETFRATLDWLEANDLRPFDLFTLQVLPNTRLRAEATRRGLRYQPEPPYYVLSTPTLSFSDLKTLRQEALRRAGGEPLMIEGLPRPGPDALTAIRNGNLSRYDPHHLIHRIVFSTDESTSAATRRPQPAEIAAIAHHLAAQVTLWLSTTDPTQDFPTLATLLAGLSLANPHTLWHLFLETPVAPPGYLTRLAQQIRHTPGYLDRVAIFHNDRPAEALPASIQAFWILPAGSEQKITTDEQAAAVIWRYHLPQDGPAWGRPGAGAVIDLAPETPAGELADLLDAIAAYAAAHPGWLLWFSDPALRWAWDWPEADDPGWSIGRDSATLLWTDSGWATATGLDEASNAGRALQWRYLRRRRSPSIGAQIRLT